MDSAHAWPRGLSLKMIKVLPTTVDGIVEMYSNACEAGIFLPKATYFQDPLE